MNLLMKLMGAASIAVLAGASAAYADVSEETLKSLGAPDKIETSAGTLEFKDGVPTAETAQKVYDTLDFTNALNAYNNSFRGASALAIVKGFEGIGARARRRRHLLRADGFELAVPDRQCRHGLLPHRARPEQRPDRDRAAVERRRHDQRHVVLLDHRHRRPGAGPRARRQIPDRRARL